MTQFTKIQTNKRHWTAQKVPCIEAREGQHSHDKTEAIRKAASELLGVNGVWVEEEEGTDEILGKPGKPPPI